MINLNELEAKAKGAREALEFIAGRQSFRDLDETEKARAFLTKYFLKDTGKPIA
jgi:hypothetical protein